MKTPCFFLLFSLAVTSFSADSTKNCGCECCQGAGTCCCALEPAATEPTAPAEQVQSHPVKGVITGLMPEKTALLVKHEAVPGVMRAMTMMFKVEAGVLEKVKSGDAIAARMSRRADGWWLTDVKVIAPAK
ncbi:MAG TPA: copper-binding protein [Lacunisphaera sp.]|nr:copper-binding protein [Lacunisphaera sp.]